MVISNMVEVYLMLCVILLMQVAVLAIVFGVAMRIASHKCIGRYMESRVRYVEDDVQRLVDRKQE